MKRRRKRLKENQGGDSGISIPASGSDYSYGYSMYGTGVGGMGGPTGDLYSVFIKPFVDVVKIGVGKTKELARRVITLGSVVFRTIMTTLLPFLGETYEEVFESEKRDLERIRSEYSDVYNATSKLFSTDAAGIAFFVAPGAFLTGLFLKKSPAIATQALSVMSGGISDKYIQRYYSTKTSKSSPRTSGMFESKNRKRIILEINEDSVDDVVLLKKIVEKSLETSPVAGNLQREARNIYKKTLESAYAEAASVLTARSIQEIERIVGKKMKMPPETVGINLSEKLAAEKDALEKMKDSLKKFYTDPLYRRIQEAKSAGIPNNNPFIVDHVSTIEKIEKL